jgi:2,3-bisphosphoglycerate-dependent phosphoglycerate mutase
MKRMLNLLLLLLNFIFLAACKDKAAETQLGDNERAVNANLPGAQPEKATVIYLVRHAEKGTNSETDPDLSAAGQIRAQALKDLLINQPLTAIYSTAYKRTNQTAALIAKAKNIQVQTYDPQSLQALATKILKENLNQTVLIVGHSNTILETIEAFKAKRPMPQLTDSDYNYLFKLTLKENQEPKVEVKRYGAN